MTIPEILRELGIARAPDGHHHARDGWTQIECPFCSPGTFRWRLGIRNDDGRCNCWTCGYHRLGDTLAEAAQISWVKVKPHLAGFTKDYTKETVSRAQKVQIPKGVGPLLPRHRRYLKERRLDPDYVEAVWKVQGIGLASKLAWRLFLPISLNAEVVSWTTRSLSSTASIPYLSAKPDQESVNHHEILYGEDLCRHAIVVNEGPLDAIAVGPGAVATLGTSYGRAQVARIAKYPVRVICFDAEPEAQRRARQLCHDLMVFPGETHNVELETGKDAVRADKREIKELRKRFLT